jgi:hypothetical protein
MSPGVEQAAGETTAWGKSGACGEPAEEWTWLRGRGMRLLKIEETRTRMRSTSRQVLNSSLDEDLNITVFLTIDSSQCKRDLRDLAGPQFPKTAGL